MKDWDLWSFLELKCFDLRGIPAVCTIPGQQQYHRLLLELYRGGEYVAVAYEDAHHAAGTPWVSLRTDDVSGRTNVHSGQATDLFLPGPPRLHNHLFQRVNRLLPKDVEGSPTALPHPEPAPPPLDLPVF